MLAKEQKYLVRSKTYNEKDTKPKKNISSSSLKQRNKGESENVAVIVSKQQKERYQKTDSSKEYGAERDTQIDEFIKNESSEDMNSGN